MTLNGFYESWPIEYPEDAYGLARTGQTILPAPDGSVIRLFVDDEPFELGVTRLLAFERTRHELGAERDLRRVDAALAPGRRRARGRLRL